MAGQQFFDNHTLVGYNFYGKYVDGDEECGRSVEV